MGANITSGVADFRNLEADVDGKYDAVISFDNSLPHLLTDEDITKALDALKTMLVDGGKLFISIRDYDALLEEKPKAKCHRSHKQMRAKECTSKRGSGAIARRLTRRTYLSLYLKMVTGK